MGSTRSNSEILSRRESLNMGSTRSNSEMLPRRENLNMGSTRSNKEMLPRRESLNMGVQGATQRCSLGEKVLIRVVQGVIRMLLPMRESHNKVV